MSELKAVHAFDVYEAYTKTGDDDAANRLRYREKSSPEPLNLARFRAFFCL